MTKTANSYILPQDNRVKSAILTAAKVTYANLTNAVKVFDAGANGSLLKRAWALPAATTVSAIQVQLFLYDGANTYFLDTVLMANYTMATTTAPTPTEFTMMSDSRPLYIPAGFSVYAGMAVAVAGGVHVHAAVEDY